MATFEARVEGLTGLSIDGSSSPTQTELTEFLKDGVIDVTERVIALKPQESIYFQRESSTYGTNGLDLGGPKIISVLRENAADGSSDGSTAWRECSQISAGKQSRVVDSTSLEYATKYNPVYIIGDSGINVYPTPDSTDDGYKVYYINNVPTDKTNEATLTYAHSDIKYFPSDKYYLVILYAACQSLLNALSAIAIGESIPSWTAPAGFVKPSFSAPSLAAVNALTLPSVPIVPTISSQSVADFSSSVPSYVAPILQSQTSFNDYWEIGDFPDSDPGVLSISAVVPSVPTISSQVIADPSSFAPTYTKPVLSLGTVPTISNLTISSASPIPPSSPSFTTPDIGAITVASTTISNVGTPPTYTAPKVGGATEELTASIEAATAGEATDKYDFSRWFDLAADYIEDEEDVELATAQLQKIRAYIESYSTQMQSNLNTFNKEDKEYQAKLQEAIQQAQINAQKATQQAQIDASKVTTDAQIEAAEKQQESALLLQKENQEYAANLQKYSGEVGAYQAEVNAKVQEWVNEEWTQKFQKYTSDYASKLQTYASDIQNESLRFDKDIQKEAQAHAAAINEVAAEIQLDTSEYNWMSQRYAALKGQYDQAFGLMAPRESEKN